MRIFGGRMSFFKVYFLFEKCRNHGFVLWLFFMINCFLFHPYFFDFTFYEDDWKFMLEFQKIKNGEKNLFSDLMSFHNYHFIPVIKLLYYLMFSCFGYKPWPFHLMLLILYATFCVVLFRLIYRLTIDNKTAFFLSWVFSSTSIFNEAIYWIGGSHFFICAFFFFSSLWLVSRDTFSTRHFFFLAVLYSSALFSFLFGVLIFLFHWGFIFIFSRTQKLQKKQIFLSAVLTLLALGVYMFKIDLWINSNPQISSLYFDIPNFLKTLGFTLKTMMYYVIPSILFREDHFLTMGLPWSLLLSSGFLTFLIYKGKDFNARHRRIAIFLIGFCIFSLFSPFLGRYHQGDLIITWGRYYVFPVISLLLLFSLYFVRFSKQIKSIVIGLLLIPLILKPFLEKKEYFPMYADQVVLQEEMRASLLQFFKIYPQEQTVKLKQKRVRTHFSKELTNKEYFKILLNSEDFNKIHWGKSVSEDYLLFVKENDWKTLLTLL